MFSGVNIRSDGTLSPHDKVVIPWTSHSNQKIQSHVLLSSCARGRKPNTKIVKGTVTSCGDDYGWIEKCVFFNTDTVKGPLSLRVGDKVLAFVEEDPLSYDLRATEVCVTSIHKQQGVLDHTIFFTFHSLKCPVGYTPLVGHVVNAVVVQSIRPNYNWRAVSMKPVNKLSCRGP
ncbi:hypothetical protein STEG23_010074 [Scotinomys teguina]